MAFREAEHVSLPVPNGWYAVAFSKDLIKGAVQPIHYFGEDMVLFRTRSAARRGCSMRSVHTSARTSDTAVE